MDHINLDDVILSIYFTGVVYQFWKSFRFLQEVRGDIGEFEDKTAQLMGRPLISKGEKRGMMVGAVLSTILIPLIWPAFKLARLIVPKEKEE